MRVHLDAEGRQLARQVAAVRVARLAHEQLGADGEELGGRDGRRVGKAASARVYASDVLRPRAPGRARSVLERGADRSRPRLTSGPRAVLSL